MPPQVTTTVSKTPVTGAVSKTPVTGAVSKTPVTGAVSKPPVTGETFHLKAYAYDHRFFHSELYHINGLPFRVDFRDGTDCPFYRPAEYRTTDPLIQQAIEEHPSFGPNVRITRINPACKFPVNPLPPNFPRTPPPPPAPRSETPEGCVTGAGAEGCVTGETLALAAFILIDHLLCAHPHHPSLRHARTPPPPATRSNPPEGCATGAPPPTRPPPATRSKPPVTGA